MLCHNSLLKGPLRNEVASTQMFCLRFFLPPIPLFQSTLLNSIYCFFFNNSGYERNTLVAMHFPKMHCTFFKNFSSRFARRFEIIDVTLQYDKLFASSNKKLI